MKTLFFTLVLFCSLTIRGQDAQPLISEAIRLEAAFQESAALEKLTQLLKIYPTHYFGLWKSSELYSRLGISQPSKQKQLAFYKRGQHLAEQAIKAHPNQPEGYYVLAVAMGRMALASPTKEKIAAVKAIKDNAEKAIRLNPNHGRAWHVLGKWHFEVSGLNVVERTAVRLFYGGFPPSSLQECIKAYERANSLEPNFALNQLELAKAYIRNDQEAKARATLQRLAALPIRSGDDNRVKAEGRVLMQSLQ